MLDDVDPNAFYGEAIRWAAGEGIVGGYGNGLFGPGDPVIREQTAAILYRCTQYQGAMSAWGRTWTFVPIRTLTPSAPARSRRCSGPAECG